MLDIIVIVILVGFALAGLKKGLVRIVLTLVSRIAVIVLTLYAHPVLSKLLRQTPLYSTLKNGIIKTLGLDALIAEQTLQAQTGLINSLPLPKFVQTALISNNNTEIYKIMKVDTITDYIGGYVANICINAISFIATFIILSIVATILINAVDLVAKLPVVNMFNRAGGIVGGLLEGVIYIWFFFIFLTLAVAIPKYSGIIAMLEQSPIAKFLYQTNIFVHMINRLFV